jgi:hypothetical protein
MGTVYAPPPAYGHSFGDMATRGLYRAHGCLLVAWMVVLIIVMIVIVVVAIWALWAIGSS